MEYDVIILGSGPAGLQAAIHAARTKASVAVVGRLQKSSLYKAHVENYCCMEGTQTGHDILEQGRRQAEQFGTQLFDCDVLDMHRQEDELFKVRLESGDVLLGWTIVLAMGISRNRLNVPGEKELLGKGVSYCVDCDANFFRSLPVAVVGSESAACSGALRLLLTSSEVHLIYDEMNVSDHLLYQVERSDIKKHPQAKVKAIVGESEVEAVVLNSGESVAVKGVFIELGAKGALELATALDIALDPESMRYIAVNKKQETNVSGVYAAGDICGPPWQMAKAVGEGCVAGLEASGYAKKKKQKSSNSPLTEESKSL